jgi:hypothetical protein
LSLTTQKGRFVNSQVMTGSWSLRADDRQTRDYSAYAPLGRYPFKLASPGLKSL